MSKVASRAVNWILLPIIMILSLIFLSSSYAADADNIISYPIQDYLSWSKLGEIPWIIDYTDGYKDKICLKSGPIKCGGASKLIVENVSGPAIIRFKWKIDVGQEIGQLVFSVDGNKIFECYDHEFADFNYPLNAERNHTLEWAFKKIRSYPIWNGTGKIDNLSFIKINSQMQKVDLNREPSPVEPKESNYAINGTKTLDRYNQSQISPGNYSSIIELKPNITVIIEKILYKEDERSPKSKSIISIEPISPKENEVLSSECGLKIKFRTSNSSMITKCEIFVDNEKVASSQAVHLENEINLNKEIENLSIGKHQWMVQCFDQEGLSNSSQMICFEIAQNKSLTIVNQMDHDESKFIYPTICEAINRTSDFGRVIIKGGQYRESIVIDKPLAIIGENKPRLSSLKTMDDEALITIKHNDVEVSGLIMNDSNYGIYIAGLKEEGVLENISIRDNEISECGYDIFAEYFNNGSIINNILYYPNKMSVCNIGIRLSNFKNIKIDSNKFNEAFRLPTDKPMKSCIHMLSYEDKTIEQIKNNTFDYAIRSIKIQREDKRYNASNIINILKENDNTFNMTEAQIIAIGAAC